jgi:large repetitive protein
MHAAGYCTAVGAGSSNSFTLSEATSATITVHGSAPTVTYGNEGAETLTATVASPAGGTPTGTVTIFYGTLTAAPYHTVVTCRITLTNGTGSCALPATALPGGTNQLTATYSGDASYAAATATATVTVAQGQTTPVLAISPATVTFGTSYQVNASVTVSPQFTGTPTGGVTVYLNGTAACAGSLTNRTATCALPRGQNAGRYQITASYGGDGNFTAANAAAQYLTVARGKSSTTLALAKATITYRHETAETLSVTVTSPVPGNATGKVTIKAGSASVCVITLQPGTTKSSGSCTLKATQLRPGTYYLKAGYAGDGNNAPSTSASKTLRVLS